MSCFPGTIAKPGAAAKTEPPLYHIEDLTRLGANFINQGWEKAAVDNMLVADILKYEATIFSVGDLIGDIVLKNLETKIIDEKNPMPQQDKDALMQKCAEIRQTGVADVKRAITNHLLRNYLLSTKEDPDQDKDASCRH